MSAYSLELFRIFFLSDKKISENPQRRAEISPDKWPLSYAKLSKLLMAVCFLFFATFFATLLTYLGHKIQLLTYVQYLHHEKGWDSHLKLVTRLLRHVNEFLL
jgi:hypothetical protein